MHFEPMSRNLNLFGSFAASAIAGTEDLVRRQLAYTEALLARNARHWRELCEKTGDVDTPEQWSQLLQSSVQGTVETMRDCMAATTEYQAETLRAIQEGFAKTQAAMTGALNDYAACAPVESRSSSEKRTARASTPLQQRAA